MQLSKSLEAYGTEDFKDTLREELEEHSDLIPLEDLMENGGWLPEGVEVAVDKFSHDDETITADITVYFDEDHPSSCADITRTDHYRAEFEVSIDRATGDADFDVKESENTTQGPDEDDYDL